MPHPQGVFGRNHHDGSWQRHSARIIRTPIGSWSVYFSISFYDGVGSITAQAQSLEDGLVVSLPLAGARSQELRVRPTAPKSQLSTELARHSDAGGAGPGALIRIIGSCSPKAKCTHDALIPMVLGP